MKKEILISIRNLSIYSEKQTLLHQLSLDICRDEILGVAGESGSGKTMLFRALLRILPEAVQFHAERLSLFGTDCRALPLRKWRRLLGTHVGWIPQNTIFYLHPDLRIRSQITDGFLSVGRGSRKEALLRAEALLRRVSFEDPSRILRSYAWQLSGGMRQRVNIAMALMNDPELLIADEPTTALDAGIARQILTLFRELHQERGISIVLISHNLRLLRQYSERIAVLYAGRLVELTDTAQLFRAAAHPYSRALLRIIPPLGTPPERLPALPGFVPDSGRDTERCIFAPRCPDYTSACETVQSLRELAPGHFCRCCLAEKGEDND